MQNFMILVDSPTAFRELLRTTLAELMPPVLPITDSGSELLTMAETCREFGVSKTTLTEWRKSGVVPFVRLGRRVYFERGKVLEAGRAHSKYTRLKG